MRKAAALSFRNKLTYAFLAVTILAVLVTGGLSYYIAAGILEDESLSLNQDSVDKSAQIMDEKLNKLMLVMMTFMISEPFKDMLESVSSGESSEYYKHLNKLDNVFSQARVAEPLIHSIYVSTPIGDFYPLSINRNHSVKFQDTPLYERVVAAKRNIWIEGHEDELFTGKSRVATLVLEPITDATVSSVRDVYVVVNIRESGLRRLIGTTAPGGPTRFLVDGDGELVARENNPLIAHAMESGLIGRALSAAEEAPLSGQARETLRGEPYFVTYASLGLNDWKIMSLQSRDDVLKDLIYVQWMIVYIVVGCVVVVMLVSSGLIRYLLRPLKSLQTVMKRVESNDLTARFEVKNGDELAQIGIRFNRMLEQIVSLIDEVKSAETTKRDMEIKALSSQMDPHFLYNTLNTIYWKLKVNKTQESQKMVVSLSRLFQLGLNKGRDFMSLGQELQHARQYLELQKYCYEQLFDYEITVEDPELETIQVPRIMLQPLVENSILHGFGGMEDGGRIAIHVKREADQCTITVEDNGSGVDRETANALLRRTTEKGYAIGNLLSRLQLYYGEGGSRLDIDSEPGCGMKVRITIPIEEGGSEDGEQQS